MLLHDSFDAVNFGAVQSPATLYSHRIQPELAHPMVAFNVYVWRFRTVAGIEKQAVWSLPQNCGHAFP